MDPPIEHMARRHGVDDEDIRHAYRNPIRVLLLDELIMIIGADRSGRPLEVGVVIDEYERLLFMRCWRGGDSWSGTHELEPGRDSEARRGTRGPLRCFDPAEAEDVPVAEYILARAVWHRNKCERELATAVTGALKDGTSWTRIGQILGISSREAEMHYGHIHRAHERSRDRGFGGPEL